MVQVIVVERVNNKTEYSLFSILIFKIFSKIIIIIIYSELLFCIWTLELMIL